MLRRIFSVVMFILLVTSMVALAFNIQPVKASGTIYIRADGSIDPPTAPISTVDNITYTFTDNINDSIVVERNNIVVDGAGNTLQGTSGAGISLLDRGNVTIKETKVKGFDYGITSTYSNGMRDQVRDNRIYNNIFSNNYWGIHIMGVNYTVYGNKATDNTNGMGLIDVYNSTIYGNDLNNNTEGIRLFTVAANNTIYNNIFAGNYLGVDFEDTYGNEFYQNNVVNNTIGFSAGSFPVVDNFMYHNNFINNTVQIRDIVQSPPPSIYFQNTWDDGYPSGGNYWSNYNSTDVSRGPYQNETGSDGIGDTPYVIDGNNRDNYPLMKAYPWTAHVDWWPMFHHNPEHTGHSTSNAPKTNSTIWVYATGDRVQSSPAVVDDKVYIGSNDGNVYCLNCTTGTYIWSYYTGSAIWKSSPAVVDDKVYIGSGNNVYCLNATTGTYIWSYTKVGLPDWFLCSPTVVDYRVYMYLGGNPTYPGIVYCLNATTGAYLWNYTTQAGSGDDDVTVSDGRAYFNGGTDHIVYCLNASTGAYMWSYTLAHTVTTVPAVADGKIYVGTGIGYLYCLNASTGTYVWMYDCYQLWDSSPAVADGKVYIGSLDHNLYCLNASTGTYIWSYMTGGEVRCSPAVADGMVCVGSYDKNIYALNDSTGEYIWSFQMGDEVLRSSPAVADGKVYIGSEDYKVYAFGPSHHNIAVTNVTSSKTVVGQGYSLNINVTVANQGDYTETFNVTAYANTTEIETKEVTLAIGNSVTLTFSWNTTDFAKGNYTLSAYAWPVEGEADTSDNTLGDTWVIVTIPGDINADFVVDIYDAILLAGSYNSIPGSPNWKPNADINGDNIVDIFDAIVLAGHFNQHYP